MTAYNVVRFRVKPGEERAFEELFRSIPRPFDGMRKAALIKTGDRTYCSIAEWESFDHIVGARPQMIGNLDGFRHLLEEFADGAGVTDAVSGEAVFEITPNG
ncbi:antibiotic biosynthesis monooxygenase [Kaistia dalseonensis]|uniref:ABM domain-containing protein n=1 Tax=Kaistia dalseonensis TaxID=410840 RepID=A0ABU0HD86_9HYPH|nr:antibiotic biosynthesis monooxygenase [Kaistia dalseonensis]MCX5497646.1 antibiotic biosynthesis monooxygenase [Kaistia dalseonensis]MDQ0440288.1 hypothetical protein [Kaistia dalseonensis]